MKYPIVFCDFDGTIYDKTLGAVPQRTVAAIHNYLNAGGQFVLTTGRMLPSILAQANRIGIFNGYMICLQGTVGYKLNPTTQLFVNDLSSAQWHQVGHFAQDKGWKFQIYHDTRYFVDKESQYSCWYASMCGVQSTIVGENLLTWEPATLWRTHKLIVYTPQDQAEERLLLLQKTFGQELEISRSAPELIEVCAMGGKGKAVQSMCNYLGYSIQQAVCIGDEINDISMLRVAGLAVCPQNAHPSVKEISHCVVASVDQCGVADFLNGLVASPNGLCIK